MADITAAQSGNWSSTSTWSGGVVPGDGDTATIADFDVTVNVNTTVGDSPITNANVITCTGTGTLTLAAGVHLTCKGGIHTNNGAITLGAGSHIEIVAGDSIGYRIYPGSWNTPNGHIVANGTLGNRCKISCTGLGTAYIYQNVGDDVDAGSPYTRLTYTDLENLGGATLSDYAIYTIGGLELQHCRIVNCGPVRAAAIHHTHNLDIQYCNCTTAKAGYDISIDVNTVAGGGTIRRIRYNAFNSSVLYQEMRGITVEENYYGVAPNHAAAHVYYPVSWKGNFIHDSSALGGSQFCPKCSVVQNDYYYNVQSDDPLIYLPWLIGDQEFDGVIIESAVDFSVDNGDAFLSTIDAAGACIFTIHNCIELPNPARRSSSSSFTSCGCAHLTYRVHNNTFFAGGYGGAYISDDNVGNAGSIDYFRDSIGWADSDSTQAYLLREQVPVPPVDPHTVGYVTMCDYHGYWNLDANRYPVTANLFAGTHGTHDLHADPMFVDKDRNLPKWAHDILGTTGTDSQRRAAAIAALAAMNDEGAAAYVAGLGVASVYNYVKAGFAPTNPLYATASSTGSYLGAVEPVLATVTATSLLMFAF